MDDARIRDCASRGPARRIQQQYAAHARQEAANHERPFPGCLRRNSTLVSSFRVSAAGGMGKLTRRFLDPFQHHVNTTRRVGRGLRDPGSNPSAWWSLLFAAVLGLGSAVPAHAQTNLVVAFDKTDYRVVEGNSLTVTVTLSPAADRQVVIPIEVTPHTLAGVAAETADYTVTGLTGGNLTFAIGNASKTFVVTANQDTDLVIDDVNLDFGTLPAAVTSSRASDSYRAVVRILDDDFTKTGTAREDQPSNRFFTEVGVPKDPEGNEIIWWIDGPESRFFWVFPYTEHATHDFGFFLVRSGVVLDRAVKDRYEFFFYYSDGNETSGADPGCSPSTASACRADYRGTIVVNVTDAPEMGAALLRRAFPPLFMGVCARGRSLLGAPYGGTAFAPACFRAARAASPA